MGRADSHLYDLHDPNSRCDIEVENQLNQYPTVHIQENDKEEAETWKCVVRMFVASGIVEKTLREAGLPEFK